jgi:ABC-type phosphate/phosphonate transport system permease subunit
MLKLIGLIIAAIPVILFLRAILTGPLGRTRTVSRAVADFRKHIDYVVWAILVIIGLALVYSAAKLIWE